MPVITVDGNTRIYKAGTPYWEIVRDFEPAEGPPALVVLENGILRELIRVPDGDAALTLVTASSEIGMSIYRRSTNFLFLKSVYDITGKDRDVHTFLRFCSSSGYYYTIRGLADGIADYASFAKEVEARMRELAAQRIPLQKNSVSLRKAREYFRNAGMEDKDRNFRYRRASSVNLYTLDDYSDYFYGYMVRDTGFLQTFRVEPYEAGLVLVLPERTDPLHVEPYRPSPKLFAIQAEAEEWAEQMEVSALGDLNDALCAGTFQSKLLAAEALQEGKIAAIAREIASRDNIKFVMIAGPSSSGKTTFSKRLSVQLTAQGLRPYPVSLDNFYLNRVDCPRDADGNYDFECLESLDLDLIRQTLQDLIAGKKVEMPVFDFVSGTRKYHGDFLQLGESDILVLEGIHGLNPELSSFLPDDAKYLIYISALTQLNIDEHNYIPTTDGRLLRRIIRDHRTRGTSAQETIRMWPSVRRGEESYIFPYQENADVMFNSALVYEPSVLKLYAEPLLFQIPENAPEYPEAHRLLKFLENILGSPAENVPLNSILREFIGGGIFRL